MACLASEEISAAAPERVQIHIGKHINNTVKGLELVREGYNQ